MKLYGITTCDSVRKARTALPQAEFIDVRKTPVPEAELQRAYQQFGDKLVNKSSATWRGLSDEDKSRPSLDLIVEHPTLMKRPLIESDTGDLYLGWGKDVQDALASS
jgi:arsenate reductase